MAGTTLNEGGLIYESIHRVLKQKGFDASEEERRTWPGRDKSEVMLEHLKKHNCEHVNEVLKQSESDLIATLSDLYFKNNRVTFVDESLPEWCNDFRKKDVLVTLNTGYPKFLQRKIIHRLNMTHFVDDWISSEEVERGRPFPDMIHTMMKRHGIQCAYQVAKFGDTPNDMREGKNAGCRFTIGVLTGSGTSDELFAAGADIVLDSITDFNEYDIVFE